jgi:hypothetical protein
MNFETMNFVELSQLKSRFETVYEAKRKEALSLIGVTKIGEHTHELTYGNDVYRIYNNTSKTKVYKMDGRKKAGLVLESKWSCFTVNDVKLKIASGEI